MRMKLVAPLVGAWIEINLMIDNDTLLRSLLSWERGLKFLTLLLVVVVLRRSSRGSVD